MGISSGEDAAPGVHEHYTESHEQDNQDIAPAVAFCPCPARWQTRPLQYWHHRRSPEGPIGRRPVGAATPRGLIRTSARPTLGAPRPAAGLPPTRSRDGLEDRRN